MVGSISSLINSGMVSDRNLITQRYASNEEYAPEEIGRYIFESSDQNFYSTERANRYRLIDTMHSPTDEILVNDYFTGRSVWVFREQNGRNADKIGVRLASDKVVFYPEKTSYGYIRQELHNKNSIIYNRSQWKNSGPNSPEGKQQFIEEHQNKNPLWQFAIGIGDEVFDTVGVVGKVIKTVGRPIKHVTGFSGVESSGRNLTQYTDSLSAGLDVRGFNRKGMAAGLGKGFTFIATSFVGVGLATKFVKATKLVPAIAAGATYISKKPLIGMPLRLAAKNAGKFERASNFKQNAVRALAVGAVAKAYSDVTTQDEFGNRDYRAIVSDAVLIPAGHQWINATRATASRNAMQKMMSVRILSPELRNSIASSLKFTRRFTPFFNAKILLQVDKTLTNEEIILINALQLRLFGAKNLRSPQDMVNSYRRYFKSENMYNTVAITNFLGSVSLAQKLANVDSKTAYILNSKESDLLTKSISVPVGHINKDKIHRLCVKYGVNESETDLIQNIYQGIIDKYGKKSQYLMLLEKYIIKVSQDPAILLPAYNLVSVKVFGRTLRPALGEGVNIADFIDPLIKDIQKQLKY